LSFVDDPTRILRAIRLEQRLDFTIEPRTSELINAAMPMLNRVTGERIRNELEMCLGEEKRIQMMARLAEYGVLAQIHPGLTWHSRTADLFNSADVVLNDSLIIEDLGEVSAVFVYFAVLILPLVATVQEEVMTRLKVRKATRDDVLAAHRLLQELAQQKSQAQPSEVYKTLQPYRERVLAVVLVVVTPNSESGGQISSYLKEWRHVRPSLNGNDLLNMGIKAGPEIGQLLERLLDARLDGELSDRTAEVLLVREMINSKGELRRS
jgi:tRNA nucleotidyltransferase (CCA-adding enzyme)